MTVELANYVIKQALITTLVVSAPALIIGLVVGLAVSIFQAVSQIHEITLTFIPKIVAIFIALIIFGPWIISVVVKFTVNILMNMASFSAM